MEVRRILYPTDFSAHSVCALAYARELAARFGAELHCVHVVDEMYQVWPGTSETAMTAWAPLEEMVGAARKQMESFLGEHFGEARGQVRSSVICGRPFLDILRYAREQKIELIVIATHGRGALASMLLGSVAEKVVRKAACPVLTVRHPEQRYEAF